MIGCKSLTHAALQQLTYPNFLGRLNRRLLKLLLAVVVVSDGSMLGSRGVTTPTPSTAIGIINSRGLFLIGCCVTVLALVFNVCDIVVSESYDSVVDCRDRVDPLIPPEPPEPVR